MDGWQTKIVPFTGGLITNQSPYQQGFNNPGSARILINYEPSVKGGYRRINGYKKAVSTPVPFHGDLYVQGSGQTGGAILLGNVFENLSANDVISIGGVEYVVSASTYLPSDFTAYVALTTDLVSSPADGELVTVVQASNPIFGLVHFDDHAVVGRGGSLFKNAGVIDRKADPSTDGWAMISKPYLGAAQTVTAVDMVANTITIDGCEFQPAEDTTIRIAGVEKVYNVVSVVKVSDQVYTLGLSPPLASAPSIGAAITVVGFNCAHIEAPLTAPILDAVEFHIGLTSHLAMVTGSTYPFILTEDGQFTVIAGIPDDAKHSNKIAYNKTTLFLSVQDKLFFSAPANAYDYSAANGGGVINVGNEITKLISFREQLIIFGVTNISRITGTTLADFQLLPITKDLGCTRGSSVREVGGDIMFLGPDGLRLLGATDRIGDFNLDPVASNIQNAINNLVTTYKDVQISSVVIRNKSQYRIFAYGNTLINGKGLIGANLLNPEGGTYWAWSEIKNLEVMYADSEVVQGEERIIFTNSTGYVYFMDEGFSFDGNPIPATYATPFIPFDDPEMRKTMYKMFMYIDPEGSVNVRTSMKFDFNDPDAVLPASKQITLSNESTAPASYGTLTAQYGVARYGGSLRAVFKSQLVGSAFSVSFFFQSEDTNPPYTLDTMTIEYAMRGRR